MGRFARRSEPPACVSAMPDSPPFRCAQIRHGTDEYLQTVRLRDALLRRPLGLGFTPSELSAEKDSFHLACRRENILAACVVLQPLPQGRIRMRQLAVRAELQGGGIGTALVVFSEQFALQQDFHEMILHARETAVGFYERLGYESDGVRFIEVTLPHFRMHKLLTRLGSQKP